jgi:hypothetical protein
MWQASDVSCVQQHGYLVHFSLSFHPSYTTEVTECVLIPITCRLFFDWQFSHVITSTGRRRDICAGP